MSISQQFLPARIVSDYVTVTPSDTTDLPILGIIGLYIGVSGDVSLISRGGNTCVFKSVPVGILWVVAQRVKQTGTTATNILALY